MIIVSTLTTGWHYFSDVLGGIAVAAIAIAISRTYSALGEGVNTSS
jgi:membrane-associated phospholipid phosphatase